MEIVIEYVLIENFIINYFIFSCCGALFKVKPKWWAVSDLFGSLMALFCPLFRFPTLVQVLVVILSAIIMVCISFPVTSLKSFCFYGFGFIFLTFVFGGANLLLSSWTGQTSVLIITLSSFVVFLAVKLFLRKLAKRRAIQSFTCSVQIACKGRVTEEVGYIDSANVLYDPITSSPIVLISKEVFEKVVGEDYVYYLLQKDRAKSLPCGHYVSVGSAVSNGEMLVFMADKLTITEKGKARSYDKPILGLSLSNFSKTLNSGVLIHSELA